MTDRIQALTVTLADDLREDDAEQLINAIHQLRGVLAVDKHVVRNADAHVARTRVTHELIGELLTILNKSS